MKKTIIISVVVTVVAFAWFIKHTTVGSDNPVNFFEMPQGIEKDILLYIVSMCSIAFGGYAYFIGHLINRFKDRQFQAW